MKEDTLKKAEEELLRTEVDIDQQCQDSEGIEQEQNQSESGIMAKVSLSASTDESKAGDKNKSEQVVKLKKLPCFVLQPMAVK